MPTCQFTAVELPKSVIFFFLKHSESDMEVQQETPAGGVSLDLQHNAAIFCSTQDL